MCIEEHSTTRRLTRQNALAHNYRLREERVDDRGQINEQKSREITSHNGNYEYFGYLVYL